MKFRRFLSLLIIAVVTTGCAATTQQSVSTSQPNQNESNISQPNTSSPTEPVSDAKTATCPNSATQVSGQPHYVTCGMLTWQLIRSGFTPPTNEEPTGFKRSDPIDPYDYGLVGALMSSFAVSPNETQVAFPHMRGDGMFTVSVANIDGTGEKELTPAGIKAQGVSVAWINDGTVAYFLSKDVEDDIEHSVDLATMTDHVIPHQSPPVLQLKHAYRTDFHVTITLKNESTGVPTGLTAQLSGNEANTVFVISPDEKMAVYEITGSEGNSDFSVSNLDGSSQKVFSHQLFMDNQAHRAFMEAGSLMWNDGHTFTFIVNRDKQSGNPAVIASEVTWYLADVDTGTIKVGSTSSRTSPAPKN